ncbi:MAG: PAS domain-containing protein, partial [Sediminibacterium sp.]|nr:PAS domain-containing protein [Sediminibacterium sp.]
IDITERKRAEEALRESKERLSKIFNASPIAISVARVSDGKLTEVNEAWSKLMGFSREEAIGYNVEELKIVDHEQRSRIREEFISKGSIRLLDSEITTKSGEKKNILTSMRRRISLSRIISSMIIKEGVLRHTPRKWKL